MSEQTEKTRPAHEVPGGTPPGRGEQTHQVMQADASRPIAGPAATSTLAAGGGLELPGREAHPYAVEHETLQHEPAKGSALDIPAEPLAGCQYLLARSARLGPLCGSQQVQNSRNEPHSGPIPGERDPGTLTPREPGGMGTLSGAQLPQVDPRAWLSEEDVKELRREGGDTSHS